MTYERVVNFPDCNVFYFKEKNVLFLRAVGKKKKNHYQGFKIDFCTLGIGTCAYGIFGAA